MSGRRGNDRRGPAQTQRIASGARSAPYQRPGGPSRQDSGAGTPGHGQRQAGQAQAHVWPPSQISIKGASGPTWVVVSNLVLGVSEADIRETFQQFGQIEGARSHKAQTDNTQSQAFEIAFTHIESAKTAVEKLNGALADGRVLQVFLREQPKKSTVAPAQSRNAPPQRDLLVGAPSAQAGGHKAAPSGPRITPATAKRDLLLGRTTANGNGAGQGKTQGNNPLQSRILSAQELKALQRQQAKTRHAPSGPNQPSEASLALARRIGSLPLAQRLATQADKAAPKSSSKGKTATQHAATSAAGKKRPGLSSAARRKAKAAGAKVSGMDVDG